MFRVGNGSFSPKRILVTQLEVKTKRRVKDILKKERNEADSDQELDTIKC